ncbi:hypothetical protein K2F54_03625 [Cryobacterium sp. 1639]|uniref:hypothetical protein n=1 Tax=Cryobacterium inferilacus TaxID=2866629 RepID=UPI001C73065D|nr:hypothetical protein [Cryobacterium sp. 1639]MBX0299060.1 hypothetical protein [Cryobacterium sp. 1639]
MDTVAVLWIIVGIVVLLALIGVIFSVAGRRVAEQRELKRQATGRSPDDTRRVADELDPAFDPAVDPAVDAGGDTAGAVSDGATRGGRHNAGTPAADTGQPPPAGRHRRDDDTD